MVSHMPRTRFALSYGEEERGRWWEGAGRQRRRGLCTVALPEQSWDPCGDF